MSLARAFTKRAKRTPAAEASAHEYRFATGTIKRAQISLPTELISTTNMRALNAPDIKSLTPSSSGSSISSKSSNGDLSTPDSSFSHISRSFLSTPATSPDTSSIESLPVTPATSTSMHNKQDFFSQPIAKPSLTTGHTLTETSFLDASPSPSIPQRAPSHSKRAHEVLHHKKSLSRMSPPPMALAPSNTIVARHSLDIFSATDSSHPFSKELAQVNEVAEEFGATSNLLDEEEDFMMSAGLMRYSADEYMAEIGGLHIGRMGISPLNPWT